ncbi:MAG: type II toxin-antitoxin system HicA family toxin [Bacteroides sp.]|nr:type II toxin-antitoxin system HicA family toxin [Bacteroides sp.]
MIRIPRSNGWIEKSQRGSHLQLIHPQRSGKITVPIHTSDLDVKTCHSILKQAGLK